MDKIAKRRLRFLDLMILTAAVAVGIAPLRAIAAKVKDFGPGWRTDLSFYYIPAYFTPLLVTLTLATTVLGLIPPRPKLRRLKHFPGFAGCFATSLGIFLVVPPMLFMYLKLDEPLLKEISSSEWNHRVLIISAGGNGVLGYIVMGAWICLGLGGRWRLGGIADYFRVALCMGWLVAASSSTIYFYVHWVITGDVR